MWCKCRSYRPKKTKRNVGMDATHWQVCDPTWEFILRRRKFTRIFLYQIRKPLTENPSADLRDGPPWLRTHQSVPPWYTIINSTRIRPDCHWCVKILDGRTVNVNIAGWWCHWTVCSLLVIAILVPMLAKRFTERTLQSLFIHLSGGFACCII